MSYIIYWTLIIGAGVAFLFFADSRIADRIYRAFVRRHR